MSDGAPLPGSAGDYRAWLLTQPAVRFDRSQAQDRLSAQAQLERFGVADRGADQQAEAQADDEHGKGQRPPAPDGANAEGQPRNHADSSPQGDGAGDDPAGAALDGLPELDKAVRVVRHGGSGEGSPLTLEIDASIRKRIDVYRARVAEWNAAFEADGVTGILRQRRNEAAEDLAFWVLISLDEEGS